MTEKLSWPSAWPEEGTVYLVKRLWDKFGDWCEKYLKANKEFQ